jgi:dihydroorotase
MSATQPTAYINARLINPGTKLDSKGSVLVENGKIKDISVKPFSGDAPSGVKIIDVKGACLAPGLVDMHVHTGEPGNEHKENFETLGAAAAAGGVTALASMPNTDPVIDNVAGIAYIERRARKTKSVKSFPYAALTKDCAGKEITEIGLLSEAGAIGFTDGTKALDDVRLLRRAMSYARGFDALILQPAIHPKLSEGSLMHAGETATRLGLAGLPPEAEALQVQTDLRLAEATGARLHIGPISMAESVQLIAQAKKNGLQVTCSTTPHYFTLTEENVGDYRTFAKLMPPLRDEENRRAIIQGLVDGTIDAIASAHHPQDVDAKRLPFAQAAFGAVGLETLLPLSLKLFHEKKMSLPQLLACMTTKPAEILRLPVGRLLKGSPADFVIFDADEHWTIQPDRLYSKSKNSPYEDFAVKGRVKLTVIDGRPVFDGVPLSRAA